MRETIFRGKRLNIGPCTVTTSEEWVRGDFVEDAASAYIYSTMHNPRMVRVDPDTVGEFSGLYDKSGNMIFEDDILRFHDEHGIWQAAVVFERGLFGLDVDRAKQIKNPDGWNQKHDAVKSRGWGWKWGYEEYGTAFSHRSPLALATIFKGDPREYENSELKKWHDKHGYGKYCVCADIIGNKHDNPFLWLTSCGDLPAGSSAGEYADQPITGAPKPQDGLPISAMA